MDVMVAGPVGTVLLSHVPELREPLDALLLGETLARGLARGRAARSAPPSPAVPSLVSGSPASESPASVSSVSESSVSALSVVAEFRDAVLRPALATLPDSRDLVDRCGRALLALGGTESDLVRQLLDRLAPEELTALIELCPALAPIPG